MICRSNTMRHLHMLGLFMLCVQATVYHNIMVALTILCGSCFKLKYYIEMHAYTHDQAVRVYRSIRAWRAYSRYVSRELSVQFTLHYGSSRIPQDYVTYIYFQAVRPVPIVLWYLKEFHGVLYTCMHASTCPSHVSKMSITSQMYYSISRNPSIL